MMSIKNHKYVKKGKKWNTLDITGKKYHIG